jgi:hypothetical protein
MKRFALLFVAFAFVVPAVGCGDSGGAPPPAAGGAVGQDEPGEAKAYKEKEAERQAQRAADLASGKIGKRGKKAQ